MLTLVYFNYLTMEFQIQRMLESGDDVAKSSLLKVSVEIIATILQLGAVRDRVVVLRHDYEFVLLTYAMPSAAVLTSMLADSVRNKNKPFPLGTSRAEVIRQLSVVVSQLDTIFLSENANYTITSQASATITRILDEVLDSPNQSLQTANETQFPLTPSHSSELPPHERNMAQNILPGPSDRNALFGMPDPFLGSYDEQGFNDWMSSIDWTAAGSEWSHL
ncbi:Hypothetical protein R9X50_00581300 [Acrodontium crateriforme]|uniref:Uncharacterized protein n=1 Tax=Acrodontium crateriforme TaxID=150365 RepID=A0AAQ3M8Q3_9PEZI|nr:Hypothetical protein R9X50_00581300 [Acrodontium crateriforme]